MVDNPTPPPHPTPLQPWPPTWARGVAFLFGIGLITFEVTIEHSQHLAVYGVGIVLTGLPIARGLDRVFDLIAGRKP